LTLLKNIHPMLATLTDKPFDKEGWIFEVKWDGYRAIAYKDKRVALISRGQKSYNARFPEIVKALSSLPGRFVVDGEIVILDAKGRSQFQLLQNYQRKKGGIPYYYLFDILSYEGKDLTKLPLIDRKEILKKLLSGSKRSLLKFSDHIEKNGIAFFRKAKRKGLEGIIAKKRDSTYQFRRSKDWLKIKTGKRQEVVIGGFTQPKGGRTRFGALLVGVYENDQLIYVGHLGGGFDRTRLEEVYQQLQKIITLKCPFFKEPHPNTPVTWVKPKLVCEAAFADWTQDGIMREPIFKGMRMDKSPRDIVRERPLHVIRT
jgi:bifunctional non-homologous end joining protein LigD